MYNNNASITARHTSTNKSNIIITGILSSSANPVVQNNLPKDTSRENQLSEPNRTEPINVRKVRNRNESNRTG